MKINNLPYKRRNQYLIGGAVVFLLFAYNVVISKTVELYRGNQLLKEKLLVAEHAPQRKSELTKKLDKFNSGLSRYISDSLKNREYLLTVVSDFCQKNNLVLKEFPEAMIAREKDFEIETNRVVAEGTFINLVKLVYELEQKNKIARIASVNFQKKFDTKRKKEVLTVTLYLQNIRMKSHEKDN